MTITASNDPAGRVSADVAVIGDGPAGSALAFALHRLGVDVVLIGPDEPWSATYSAWVDDIDDLGLIDGVDVWAYRFDHVRVRFGREREIERAYGVIDNEALRARLRAGIRHVTRTVGDAEAIDAFVVDATGWPSKLASAAETRQPAFQTAFGVVFVRPPSGALGVPTMMDYSDPGETVEGRPGVPTFAYSLPVPGGWLVEETVLTASPAVDPDALQPVLAARLGLTVDELAGAAIATERVRIPMGAPPPPADDPGPVRFGAAAGMIHPATGYSVASSLRQAGGVAAAITTALDGANGPGRHRDEIDAGPVRKAVWNASARRTRQLHDYGHDVLLGLDREGLQRFFDAFFDLPVETWSPYLRTDTPPSRVARIMAKLFATAPMRLRVRLVAGDPRRLLRLIRR